MKGLRTIILAAGKGTRMKSDLPKILHPVCGKPMIQYVVDLARRVSSLKTFVVLGHQNKAVRKDLDKRLSTVIQKRLLGTADAVKSAQKHFRGYNGDVLVLCGDTPLLIAETVRKLIRIHRRSKAGCTFLSAVVEHPENYGRVVRDAQGRVVAIREEKDASYEEKGIHEINTGVYCFRSKDLFASISSVKLNRKKKEFYLTDIVELFLEKGIRVDAVQTADFTEGVGINDRSDLAFAEWVLRQRVMEKMMLSGVTIIDPQTTYIDAQVRIGKDSVIYPFTVIEGESRIGNKCKIGPFAHIRPGSKIGNQVEIGNFAEISRSALGDRSFMKHFSFLGDTSAGAEVNIGAGVVTANFDGKNKYHSVIGKGAFIGSDSTLVAPVHIGKNAVTGAGSVITKGKRIPAGSIAVGVPAKIVSRRKS